MGIPLNGDLNPNRLLISPEADFIPLISSRIGVIS